MGTTLTYIIAIACLIWLIIQIIMIVKFFQIASDIRNLKQDRSVILTDNTIEKIVSYINTKLTKTTEIITNKINNDIPITEIKRSNENHKLTNIDSNNETLDYYSYTKTKE